MAYPTQLYTNTLSNQNIAAALLVGTYTNTSRERLVIINLWADQIAGNGNYVVYATRQRSGAGSAYEVGGRTTVAVPSGVTAQEFPSIQVLLNATDVLKCYIVGLAGDTATPDLIMEVDELFILTDASGRVDAYAINSIVASAITAINANLGTTQPINFTGTGAAALTKSDVIDIASAIVNTALAQLGVNVVSQANIDFGALQKTSLNAATPASVAGAVGSVTGNVTGSIGSLANQAKTDVENSVLDATQASHVAAGTIGESINDASSGPAPTVQQIDTQLSATHGAGLWGGAAGTGFYTVEIPCEVSGVPADGVAVRVTNDIIGNNIVAQATSDTNGTATVYLDAGSYYIWLQRGGDTFPNPTLITVP